MGVTPLAAGLRPPLVDGLFYPARRATLAAYIDDMLARSETPKTGCFGVIAPHAGYDFTGLVMAAAYRSLALRRPRIAVVIGPVHRDPAERAFLPESTAFATPLGDVGVDRDAVDALLKADRLFQISDIPHLEEHCIELQIPFLQRLFPAIAIVPILISSARVSTVSRLAEALADIFSAGETVYVATSNMASYMTGHDMEAENAAAESLLVGRDWRGLLAAAGKKTISACGAAGMAAVVRIAGETSTVRTLARSTSRAQDEDTARVVHYVAVSIETSTTSAP